ncbi:MAG TPA: hypothetical protein DGG94_14205 [Micromonosporaceae bacterium]|nr:hypothetical protein [Micromonosporaceae bacterium]HCU50928.1 hypothetical protein [Micromonosporaceae bacterium]
MTPNKSPAAEDLRPLLKRGLPAAADVIAGHLLELSGVAARATTRDRDSRVAAFNALLGQLIRRMTDPGQAAAAGRLFGERATAGHNLTERRAGAALSLGRDPDHFRKHIEPRILADLAAALAADSDRMITTRATPPQLIPVLHPRAELPQDMWAWEAVEHEEHISRLWAAVYALRAELLACERVASFDPLSVELRDAADAALWRLGQLHVAIRTYRRAYGNRLLHGDIAPETLIGLAGWSPPLGPGEVDVVCHLGPDTERCRIFITDLIATEPGARIHAHWFARLSIHPHNTAAEAGSTA